MLTSLLLLDQGMLCSELTPELGPSSDHPDLYSTAKETLLLTSDHGEEYPDCLPYESQRISLLCNSPLD